MSKYAHTPGPWRALRSEVKAGRYNVCPHVTAGGSSRGMIDDMEVAAANARLIAAAPDLLEALQLAVRKNSCDMYMTGEEIRKCEAAIAKATGEKP